MSWRIRKRLRSQLPWIPPRLTSLMILRKLRLALLRKTKLSRWFRQGRKSSFLMCFGSTWSAPSSTWTSRPSSGSNKPGHPSRRSRWTRRRVRKVLVSQWLPWAAHWPELSNNYLPRVFKAVKIQPPTSRLKASKPIIGAPQLQIPKLNPTMGDHRGRCKTQIASPLFRSQNLSDSPSNCKRVVNKRKQANLLKKD